MKYITYLSILIIFIGAAYSLYNAADDYGLRTISLPEFIKAQAETTNGDSTNGDDCDNIDILCEMSLEIFDFEGFYPTNQSGTLFLPGGARSGYIPDEVYLVKGNFSDCQLSEPENTCDRRKTGWRYKSISLDSWTGDSTNGDNTN